MSTMYVFIISPQGTDDSAGVSGDTDDLRISDDGITINDIETMCQEMGKGDEDKDQEVVLTVLTVCGMIQCVYTFTHEVLHVHVCVLLARCVLSN